MTKQGDTFVRNVGNHLPRDAALQLRRMELFSITRLLKKSELEQFDICT
jgi:hypothetical protein